MSDLLRAQRLKVAAAYRRLADEATKAAFELSDPAGQPPASVQVAVLGRVQAVRHAHQLLSATALGEARSARTSATKGVAAHAR